MRRYKRRGVMLITTVVAVTAWILLAGGLFLAQSGELQMLAANHEENQAKQYAEVNANLLKGIDYSQLTDANILAKFHLHMDRGTIQTVDAPDWEDEIAISNEKTARSGAKFRTATINIYQKGDTKPRFRLDISLEKDVQPPTRGEIDKMIAQKEKEEQAKIDAANKFVDDTLKKAGVDE